MRQQKWGSEYVHGVDCIEAIVSQNYLKHINSKFAVIILAHGIWSSSSSALSNTHLMNLLAQRAGSAQRGAHPILAEEALINAVAFA